jgi:hypothetical protein
MICHREEDMRGQEASLRSDLCMETGSCDELGRIRRKDRRG